MDDFTHMRADEALIERLQGLIARCKAGREGWVTGTLGLAAELFAASKQYPSTHAFSAWCKANIPDISARDRAGLLRIGVADPAEAEAKLRDLRTSSWETAGNAFKPRVPKNRKAAGGSPPSSPPQLDLAPALETVEEALERLPPKSRMRVDKLVETLRGKLRKSYRDEVTAEAQRQIAAADDAVRKERDELRERVRGYERMVASMRDSLVFSQAEFRLLQMAVHPDNSASPETRARASQLLAERAARLVRSK